MINALVLLYNVCFENFGLSIIVFTVIVRIFMWPLTVKQARFTKKMSEMQPRIQAVQKKYANDKQAQSRETMKVYREAGFNPLGCLGPVLIQFPIWIGLYQAIIQTLPTTPDKLADLSRYLYSWTAPIVHKVVPLSPNFMGVDLAVNSSHYWTSGSYPGALVLPVVVGASMFLMQKMTMTPSASPSQDSTNRMMLWMLPIMFGFFTFQFPTGLAVYWVVSNIIGIIMQGFITGWEPLTTLFVKKPPASATTPAEGLDREVTTSDEQRIEHEHERNVREDGGRSDRVGSKRTQRRTRRGRNRRR